MVPLKHTKRSVLLEASFGNQLDMQQRELFLDNLRRFLNEEVAPHYEDWESSGIWPRSLWNRLGEEGFLCVDMPEVYGGLGTVMITTPKGVFSKTEILAMAKKGEKLGGEIIGTVV